MKIKSLKKGHTSMFALAFALAGALPMASSAAEVALKSADGTVNLSGEFVEFKDDSYVIRTALGDLRISASRVRCEGEACPTFDTTSADVKFAGSDTVGLGLMPLLLTGYASFLNAEAALTNTETEGEVLASFVGDEGFGDEIGSYLVTSTGSSDAFTNLLENEAQIGMSSRRIRPAEARALRDAGAGNMVSPEQEHVVAVDSLVVITHPSNPISTIAIEDLARIFSGQVTNWSEVGGPDLPITTVNRADGSGTRTVFEGHVFGDNVPSSPANQEIVNDNNAMAARVNADEGAIGFVGYAFQRGAKALDIVNECGIPTKPDSFSAKTEEYTLQRRLYLYNRADSSDSSIQDFLSFATSQDADGVIAKSGFIDLGVARRSQSLDSDRARLLIETTTDPFEAGVMREMLDLMPDYDRLSSTFRFKQGSSRLDEKGLLDMERLITFLEREPEGATITLVGFTDSVGAFEANRNLAIERARQVAFDLQTRAGNRLDGVTIEIAGFGEMAPSACNTSASGQAINRRVEVWLETDAG